MKIKCIKSIFKELLTEGKIYEVDNKGKITFDCGGNNITPCLSVDDFNENFDAKFVEVKADE